MATQGKRARTTDFVEDKFKKCLDADDLVPALLFTSNVVHKRLRQLLAFRIRKDGDDWIAIYEDLNMSFGRTIKLCATLRLIRASTVGQLRSLSKWRNQAAHETEIWQNMSDKEKEEVRHLCESAISFLRRTDEEEGMSEESPTVS